ncbi:MAG: cytidine deaminase [Spartobacteria bacterium]|nr:cytidine deaminase [Spartobacteria bacterium]
MSKTEQTLVSEAMAIRRNAYAPYSRYKVGAALLDEVDVVHTGCNVEGADLTLTTHAEMMAINSMVKSGILRLKAIAVVVKANMGKGMPCGLCRQKINEFAADRNVHVLGVNLNDAEEIRDIYRSSLNELLPFSFGPGALSDPSDLSDASDNHRSPPS